MKNDPLYGLLTRRSVRSFSGEPVSPEIRRKLLEAGMAAPSAHGQKPWYFAFIESEEIKKKIIGACPWFAQPLKTADFSLLVMGSPGICRQSEYWIADCAAAAENILIAARILGLGSVWQGIAPVKENIEKIRSVLKIPEELIPFALIAIGYPADTSAWKIKEPLFDCARVIKISSNPQEM